MKRLIATTLLTFILLTTVVSAASAASATVITTRASYATGYYHNGSWGWYKLVQSNGVTRWQKKTGYNYWYEWTQFSSVPAGYTTASFRYMGPNGPVYRKQTINIAWWWDAKFNLTYVYY